MERATIILNTEHTLERSVPGMVNSNISMMVPWNYSLGVKADIQKCHTHADAYRVRFHSRHNRLKGDPVVSGLAEGGDSRSGECREC